MTHARAHALAWTFALSLATGGTAFAAETTEASAAPAAAASQATSTTSLAWRWEDGQVRRYLLRSQLQLPEAIPMLAEFNTDAFVIAVNTTLVVACRADRDLGKRGTLLHCDIEDAAFSATPLRINFGTMEDVTSDWSTRLPAGGYIELEQRPDGRLVNIDLGGIDKSRRRLNQIHGTMRLLAIRAFAPLDVQLTRKGEAQMGSKWTQKNALQPAFPALEAQIVGLKLNQEVHAFEGDEVVIHTFGRASVASAEEREGTNARNIYICDVAGSARFDLTSGALTEAQYLSEGAPTTNSIVAQNSSSAFVQAAVAQLLAPDQKVQLGDQPAKDETPASTP